MLGSKPASTLATEEISRSWEGPTESHCTSGAGSSWGVAGSVTIRNVTIHDLRRTFATLLAATGAPDAVIASALGHSPQGVTQRHYLPRRRLTV